MNVSTIYEVNPDLSELDAMQVLLLVNLSAEEGLPDHPCPNRADHRPGYLFPNWEQCPTTEGPKNPK
jgi:hypothetical protein